MPHARANGACGMLHRYGALGRVLTLKGDFVGAVKLFRRQRELLCDILGPDDERVLKADHAISIGLLNGGHHMPGLKLLKEVPYACSQIFVLASVAFLSSSDKYGKPVRVGSQAVVDLTFTLPKWQGG